MNLTLDLQSAVPIYQQIRDRVIEQIALGEVKRGDPLPSTRQLAAGFGINFHTVTKAYDLLRQEGVIRITRKSGAVVSRDQHYPDPVDDGFVLEWRERLRVLLAEAAVQGLPHQHIRDHCAQLLSTFQAGEDL